MSKGITYEPINFRRISDASDTVSANNVHRERRNTELFADVVMNSTAHKRKMFRYVKNTAIVAAVAFTILFRYTLVANNNTKISKLEKQYTEISESNINLQCEIDSKTDSDSIEAAALKLGMAQPSKSQKISVDVVGGDYVEVAKTQVAKTSDTGHFYATMIETLGNVLEYLY